MDANFLSGLLLLAVVLFGAGYLIKTFFWESWAAYLSTERKEEPPRGTNEHLIGAVGRVVDDGARSGKMRVRVGMETWPAHTGASDAELPVGAQVEVKAISGRMLEVAVRAPDEGAAEGSPQDEKPGPPDQ